MDSVISRTIVDIPISKISPHPDNPRGPVPPGDAQAMAESLKEVGQEDEIRVRPFTEDEKAKWLPYEYMLRAGHVRLEAAHLLGWETLRAVVEEGATPDGDLMDMVLNNRSKDMGWWKWDLVIEKLYKAMPEPSQRILGAQLGWSVAKVNRALKVTGALTPQARELVTQNLSSSEPDEEEGVTPGNTKNKGFLLTNRILRVLADLEDPQEVEKALNRVVDDEMTESQVRQMVAGLKGEAAPAHTPANGKSKAPATPPSDANQPPTGKPSAADDGDSSKKGGLTGLFSGLFHPKSLVSAGLAGVVGAFLLKNLKRALGTLARRWMIHAMVGLGIVALLSPHLFVSVSQLFKPKTDTARPVPQNTVAPEPKSESRPAPVKHAHAVPHKAAKVPVAHLSPEALAQGEPQALSPEMEAWAASDAPLAGEFASRFYGVSYMNWDGTMDYFKAHMTEDESPVFIQQYFPPTLLRQFQEKRLVLFFDASKPPQLVKVGGTKDEFLAQGTVTTVSNLDRSPQTLSKKPVALVMEIWHVQGFGTRVGTAVEVSPEEAQALSQNAPILPVGNPKDSSQKDKTDPLGNAIEIAANKAVSNAANDAVSQGIKKLSPF